MAILPVSKSVVLCLFAFSFCACALNNTNFTGTRGTVPAVFLDNEAAFAVCVYPTSGSYSFLNRLLYYCTLVFSLFSRAHLWLVAGALAAALTYSGTAAIHACLLVWRGPNPYIENDSWVLYSILNSACLITVPLLNWSGTLRRLGAKAASINDPKGTRTQGDVSTRTIVIYWAFLVLVGFICIWQQILFGAGDNNMEYPDMSKVMCQPGTNASMLMSPNGTLHRRPIDMNFIQDNNCNDPCNQINVPAIFRKQNDLVLLSPQKSLLWNNTLSDNRLQKLGDMINVEMNLFILAYYTLPFILIQGFVTAFFGRRDPREIRDLIYINLFMERPLSRKPFLRKAQDIFARMVAAFNYLLACIVVILCPPLFIVTVLSAELQFWAELPASESLFSVGQWGPWAVAGQVLLAAIIARYHDKAIAFVCRTWFHIFNRHPEGDHEHGRISTTGSHCTNSDSDPESALKGSTKTDVMLGNHTTDLSTMAPTGERPTLWHSFTQNLKAFYKMAAHPLNQNDKGLFDEFGNFIHWLRDPQAVSRRVVRHPIRVRVLRDMAEDEGEDRETAAAEAAALQDNDAGPLRVDGDGQIGGRRGMKNNRQNSGFFRGASLRNGDPRPNPHVRMPDVPPRRA